MPHIFEKFSKLLYVDLRSLALTRIVFSSLIIVDLLIRSFDLKNHYTDEGVLPVEAFYYFHWKEYYISLHALSGDYYYQLFLFIVALLFALLLLVGFRTRLTTFISWFLLISLHSRNPLVLHAGDTLLRCLMFWAIFIPWGERFSIDSLLKDQKGGSTNKVFSLGVLAFILQILFMYLSTAVFKNSPEWRTEYTAVYYALSIGHFSYLLGPYLYQFPSFMKVLTFFVFWLELIGFFLFFVPYRNNLFRILALSLFTFFQLGLFFTMRLGLFPLVSTASLLIFIPSLLWEKIPNLENRLELFFSRFNRRILIKFINKQSGLELNKKIGVIIISIFMVVVLLWNLKNLKLSTYPKDLNFLIRTVRLDQKWNMFSPKPYRSDGWYVIVGLLENGSLVDIFREGKPVSWDPPENRHADYPTYRWRKFMRNIYLNKYENNRPYYAKYVCNKWNVDKSKDQRVNDIDIYYVVEWTLPNYKTRDPVIKKLISYKCP